MNTSSMLITKSNVRGGNPVIKGTRIAVTDVVRFAAIHIAELSTESKDLERPKDFDKVLLEEPWRSQVLRRLLADWPHVSKDALLQAWDYYRRHKKEVESLVEMEDAAFKVKR